MSVVGRIRGTTSPEAIAHWRDCRRRIAASAFAPKSILTLSQWADQYRYLSADLGEPGLWRTSRVPYLRVPMDAITDPRVRRVSVMKSARIGATQGLVLNTIGYYVHQEPTPIIAGLPTIDDGNKFSSALLQPMIDDTPVLFERIQSERSKKRRSTMLTKTFPGGAIHIVGTKSPRALRMVHARIILKSEIDAWEGSSGDDGDPYNLIDKRAGAYGSPKFIEESTPLVRETSRIEPAFLAGSAEYYHVPCPHCKEYQRLVWGGRDVDYGIKWGRKANGEPDLEQVYYVCQKHGCEILENEKHAIVQAGDWLATHPERREHRSFHLNALISPFEGARWPLLVDEWYKTERKPEKTRVFVNTILGETYVEAGEQADESLLTTRRDEGIWWTKDAPVPEGAAKLTRSTDTQGNRLETSVWAWGEGEECWLIDFEVLPGDPATSVPWDALDERIGFAKVNGRLVTAPPKSYRHVSGRQLVPSVSFIDAGGHHSKQVKAYARRRVKRRVFAIYGAKDDRAPVLGAPTTKKRGIQFAIGVFAAKEALLKRIEKIDEPGPGYIHLPPWLEDEQVKQLVAEKLIVIGDKRRFKKTRERNEMTDLWVYALAALHHLGDKVMNRLGVIAEKLMQDSGGGPAPAPSEPADDPPVAATTRSRVQPPRLKKGFVNRWR